MNKSYKIYARRDSATSVLRKIGIDKEHYNNFIKQDGGNFYVDVDAATKSLVNVEGSKKLVKSTTPKVNKKSVGEAKPQVTSTHTAGVAKKETISGVICQLIMGGKTNKEIWGIVKSKFNLDDTKKYYPAWNRSQMIRDGRLK